MLWPALMVIPSVLGVGRKERGRTRVLNRKQKSKFCILLTPEQKAQLATPSYKLKKEKHDARKADISSTPSKDNKEGTLVDRSTISVIGAVSDTAVSSPPFTVPEKKTKKDKPSSSKSKTPVEKSATDKKTEELDQKWSDRFTRLEALLMSKTFQPTFTSAVKVTPSHSPPSNVPRDNEPFFQPTSSERTGQDSSAMHQSASQLSTGTFLKSALDWASLLYCVSLPASSDPTLTGIFT